MNGDKIIDLAESRKEIDSIDSQISELFLRRMEVACNVADYKLATGKPILDKEREEAKIADLTSRYGDDDFHKRCISELFSQLMAMSRKLQYGKLELNDNDSKLDPYETVDTLKKDGVKAVYQGVPGAYSHEAMIGFFGQDVNSVSVDSFREAMEMVHKGSADYAVIPIDNSSAGMVSTTYDLLDEYNNYIVAETFVKISHCLLGVKGAKPEDIKTVYSHQQALMQCSKYLDSHSDWSLREYLNTAMSARKIAEEGDITHAAVASENCAKEYGLDVLARDINNAASNTTRFVIVSNKREFVKDAHKVSVCFEVPHKSGSLYNALSHIMFNGLNMTKIESRPIPEHNWEFRFYVDFEGNLRDPGVKNALRGICEEGNAIKLLGNY